MAQIFHPSMNTLAKASIFGAIFFVVFMGWLFWELDHSSYHTGQFIVREQPVPFSHEHHVRGLGIDCRYCHSSVEKSPFAGMPSTKTCMTCHSKLWTDAALLAPVRDSWASNQPIVWRRVHNLPEFVYFNHSIHVAKGIGCSTCHGQVNQMPLMYQAASLQMEWCLSCHRDPAKFIRPKSEVFNMDYAAPADQLQLGSELVAQYHVNVGQLTNCNVCHR